MSGRRTLLARGAALGAAAALPAVTPPASAGAGAGADAGLIALCEEYKAALAAYEADGGYLVTDDDPLWEAVEAVKRRLDGMAAATLAGVVAKARVARCLARQPGGREDYCSSFTADWPGEVVRDLLALADGRAA